MAQSTTVHTPEVEEAVAEINGVEANKCCHHWVIQPADGPVSDGSCQVCGETREFKNYVEAATWGDSRTTGKGSAATATAESTSDDEATAGPDSAEDEPESEVEPDATELEPDATELESED